MKWEQVKNWPWKRIIIGSAVISSIAASTSFGTYAYFTSQVEDSTTFAAGKLEISLGENKTKFQAEADQPFLPGVRVEKTLSVENSSDVPVKYALLAEKADGDDIVYDQLVAEIRRTSDDELLYHGRISTLTQANVVIHELDKGERDQLHFTVYLPESTGNEVQEKSAEVNFGFLATQQENGDYFAQSGPVMTFTPQDLSGKQLLDTMKLANRVGEEESSKQKDGTAAKGMTFVLAAGSYDLSGMELPKHITWKAAPGQEGKVIIRADELEVHDASFEGIRFEGRGTGLLVGSNVSFRNCTFSSGFDEAIRTAGAVDVAREEGTEGGKFLEGLTVKDSVFEGADQAIVLNQTIKAALIANNTFSGGKHAVVIANDKETQVQIVDNDFTKVNQYAVESGGVRVGDGIDGFKEIEGEVVGTKKLALHLYKADVYLENNKYAR
ncbi:SipW-dependent-type signal peptide-containing protein [Brevibacillus choshinensis]|uniref:SipW-dependent-type signal peptide-containing protein n=1 Tax=Brevibacillus choshinensis TaxID=54911 RepID=UPI002E1A6F54|nr:SipW-dependent-type signal peptide-containing protein [Brevibacillus choshinensis]MED4782505.1 SipW-dependent-type signal peptide-containing protein [Brevibacillus choshinensis]